MSTKSTPNPERDLIDAEWTAQDDANRLASRGYIAGVVTGLLAQAQAEDRSGLMPFKVEQVGTSVILTFTQSKIRYRIPVLGGDVVPEVPPPDPEDQDLANQAVTLLADYIAGHREDEADNE